MTELIYDDGKLPNQEIIDKLSEIVDNFFAKNDAKSSELESKPAKKSSARQTTDSKPRIGVHCVAGLGRAPLLVAIALVNKGCTPINAINLIRKQRVGALNQV